MIDDGGDLISIERDLHEAEQEAQRGPRILADAYKTWRDADRAYEIAKAHAHLKAKDSPIAGGKPTVADIEARVTLDTILERTEAEVAEAAHRYAASRVKELENRRSSLQTRAKLVVEQMHLAGTGRTA